MKGERDDDLTLDVNAEGHAGGGYDIVRHPTEVWG